MLAGIAGNTALTSGRTKQTNISSANSYFLPFIPDGQTFDIWALSLVDFRITLGGMNNLALIKSERPRLLKSIGLTKAIQVRLSSDSLTHHAHKSTYGTS